VQGITAYSCYIPHYRLTHDKIRQALGAGPAKGSRSVASFDEDTTSMAVEAALPTVRAAGARTPQRLLFATATPAYLDKSSAATVHAALGLPDSVAAVDVGGALGSGAATLVLAADSTTPTLAVMADQRTGLAGGTDERDGGDVAAAFLLGGPGPVLAEVLSTSSSTLEVLERWRLPGDAASRSWEDRFAESAYAEVAHAAFVDALKRASLTPDAVDHLIVSGMAARAVRSFVAATGVPPSAVADDLTTKLGNGGAAQIGLLLAAQLDVAQPGQVIVAVHISDGATAVVLRATKAIAKGRQERAVTSQVEGGDESLMYTQFLHWRGQLTKEPPRRPDPAGPSAPAALRNHAFKFALRGTRCTACQTVHVTPSRVCADCHARDEMEVYELAHRTATIRTFTIDRLAYTPSPPLIVAVIDFDGGGRMRSVLTDVSPDAVAIGDRVRMTFRRVVTAEGIHNYFWKACPVNEESK
jgi:hydroxymethylglutaryl-CoA synthase